MNALENVMADIPDQREVWVVSRHQFGQLKGVRFAAKNTVFNAFSDTFGIDGFNIHFYPFVGICTNPSLAIPVLGCIDNEFGQC